MVSDAPYFRTHALHRSRHGMIFGVCKGLADYAQISPIWIRATFVILALTTAIFPVVLAYIIFAILLRPAPMFLPKTEDDWALYSVYTASKRTAAYQLRKRMEELDRRARRIEDIVTARGFDWDRRLKS